jgi:hypothetical protein
LEMVMNCSGALLWPLSIACFANRLRAECSSR